MAILCVKLFENFVEVIKRPQTIIGLVLVILAFVLMILSKKIVEKFKPEADEEKKTTYMLTIKLVALGLVIVGLLVAIIF